MSDSFYRIHVGCLLGRDVTKQYANEDAHHKGYVDAPCRHAAGHAKRAEEGAGRTPYENTYQATCDTDKYGFYQELEWDLGGGITIV